MHFRIENVEAFQFGRPRRSCSRFDHGFLACSRSPTAMERKVDDTPCSGATSSQRHPTLGQEGETSRPAAKDSCHDSKRRHESCSKEQPLKRNRPGEMERPRKTGARGQSLESTALEGRGECCLHNVKKDGGPREDGEDKCATMSWERDVEMKIARSHGGALHIAGKGSGTSRSRQLSPHSRVDCHGLDWHQDQDRLCHERSGSQTGGRCKSPRMLSRSW